MHPGNWRSGPAGRTISCSPAQSARASAVSTGWRMNGASAGPGFSRSIASYGPHFGEEPPLVGRGGSGTIFVSHCNLACTFCQNYEISQVREGM